MSDQDREPGPGQTPGDAPEPVIVSTMPVAALEQPPRQGELRLLLMMAAPNVASTAAETLLSFVDYAIVSQIGPAAQAAVQSGALVFFTMFAFMLGVTACVSTTVSQSLGAGRLRDCSSYAWQGVWVSLLFGGLGVALWPFIPTLFAWINHAPDVQAMQVDYTRIRLLSLAPAGMAAALGHFFIGVHHPRINAWSVAGSNVINGFLSYALVLGKWGMPEMGVAGAALGTVIAAVIRVAWLLGAMCLGRASARFAPRETWRVDREKMYRLLQIGWPAGAAFVFDIAAWSAFFIIVIGGFGTAELAASSTCWRFTELSFMPAIGIGMAVAALVGRAIGEGRPDLARRRARLGAMLNLAYMGTMGVLFIVFGGPMVSLFSNDADVIRIGTVLMAYVAVFQVFDAVAINYSSALRGAGDTRWPAVVCATLSWTIMVGGGTLAARFWPELGARGPWCLATLFLFTVGAALWLRWRGGRWEQLDVIGHGEPVPLDDEPSPTEGLVVPGSIMEVGQAAPAMAPEPAYVETRSSPAP